MSKGLMVVVVVLVLGAASCFLTIMGVSNSCISQENGIDYQYDTNKSALAGYANRILDMVQVPKMAKDQILEITKAAIQGRYGEKGAQAVFVAIREQNPTVDASLYRTLMQSMEAGRTSFDAEQTETDFKNKRTGPLQIQ